MKTAKPVSVLSLVISGLLFACNPQENASSISDSSAPSIEMIDSANNVQADSAYTDTSSMVPDSTVDQ